MAIVITPTWTQFRRIWSRCGPPGALKGRDGPYGDAYGVSGMGICV